MKNNSLDILKKLGTGFKAPEGYFESMEDQVLSKLNTKELPTKTGYEVPPSYFDSIEEKVLSKIKQTTAQKQLNSDIPSDYFSTIEDRVLERIKNEDAVEPKVIDFRKRFVKVFIPVAIAASFLLILVLNLNDTPNYSIEDLASSEVESWIENDLISIDSDQIAEVFNDTNLYEEFSEEDENVLEYLNGMDIESELLIE